MDSRKFYLVVFSIWIILRPYPLGIFNNDLFIINVGKKYDFSEWHEGEIIDEGKFGLADSSGKIILAAKYDDL